MIDEALARNRLAAVPLRVYGSAAAALVPKNLRALARIERPAAADAAAIARDVVGRAA